MTLLFEDLRVLQTAEVLADGIWHQIIRWDLFSREVVGNQLARAVDSIGANIAESFGRYHFGEKLQFLYYARGSLYETKYWLNRSKMRSLITNEQAEDYTTRLNSLGRELNAFAQTIKNQRYPDKTTNKTRESPITYEVSSISESYSTGLLTELDFNFLQTQPVYDGEYPLSNP